MPLAIREILTDRLLDTTGTWTTDHRRARLFNSFADAVGYKGRKKLELAHVIEFPPRFSGAKSRLSELD